MGVNILWGMGASVLLTLLVGYYVVRKTADATLFGGSHPSHRRSGRVLGSQDREVFRRRCLWLVQVRWIVIVLLLSAIGIFGRLATFLPRENLAPLVTCALVLLFLNIFYTLGRDRLKNTERFLILQMVVDLVLLTALLFFSGGIENPFSFAYIFSVITAGTLLRRRQAVWLTVFTGGLFLTIISLDLLQLIRHPLILRIPQNPLLAAGQVLSFFLAIAFAGSLTILLHDKIRRDERQIILAGKMASMGEMAGRIVHEINNPLTIVQSRVKLILERERGSPGLSPKTVLDLERMDLQCERISELTTGLLSLGSPTLGARSPLSVNHLIEETLNLLEPGIRKRGIQLVCHLSQVQPEILGNGSEMQQVLLNLIGNSLDAMESGGILRIETWIGEKNSVEISIQDTGEGISSDLVHRIFEPFFTTKKEGKGTGLGLAISEGLVRSHGGHIEVESEVGEGTTMTLRLPRIKKAPGTVGLVTDRWVEVENET